MDSKQRAAETTEQRARVLADTVWEMGYKAHGQDDFYVLILAALRAEREACAQIADGLWNGHIAAAIRGRE